MGGKDVITQLFEYLEQIGIRGHGLIDATNHSSIVGLLISTPKDIAVIFWKSLKTRCTYNGSLVSTQVQCGSFMTLPKVLRQTSQIAWNWYASARTFYVLWMLKVRRSWLPDLTYLHEFHARVQVWFVHSSFADCLSLQSSFDRFSRSCRESPCIRVHPPDKTSESIGRCYQYGREVLQRR